MALLEPLTLSPHQHLAFIAALVPAPTDSTIGIEMQTDRNKNPHGDVHKPKARTQLQIIAQLRVALANAIINEAYKEA